MFSSSSSSANNEQQFSSRVRHSNSDAANMTSDVMMGMCTRSRETAATGLSYSSGKTNVMFGAHHHHQSGNFPNHNHVPLSANSAAANSTKRFSLIDRGKSWVCVMYFLSDLITSCFFFLTSIIIIIIIRLSARSFSSTIRNPQLNTTVKWVNIKKNNNNNQRNKESSYEKESLSQQFYKRVCVRAT